MRNTERLLALADYLETVPEEKFSLTTYVCGTSNASEVKECLKKVTCGTVACAVGYLPMVWPDVFEYYAEEQSKYIGVKYIGVKYIGKDLTNHVSGIYNSFASSCDWLGLEEGEWCHLFTRHRYAGRAGITEVVARIREFANEG